MNNISFFAKGAVIGFSIAAPVGPIGVLCIRRSLAQGTVTGLCTGLGAATADAAYGAVAGFGLTAISGFLVRQQFWLALLGGAFLCYLGIKTFLSKPAEEAASAEGKGLLGAYLSTVALTVTNPMTILSFVAIFAGLGLASSNGDYGSASVLVAGVFVGSGAWWLLLSGGVGLLRSRVTAQWIGYVNRLSGVIIVCFGVYQLATLILRRGG